MQMNLDFTAQDATLHIAGVDEAGRGPLAGSVFAAAVVLPVNSDIPVRDSKKLSEKKRESLFEEIKTTAIAWAIAEASVEEIDSINILQATFLAMQRAVGDLEIGLERVLVDGNKAPDFGHETECIVKGDDKVQCISAASILAKVARDRSMLVAHEAFPQYGFNKHKGYGTKVHLEAIKEHGPCELHRKTFAPIKHWI